MAQLTIVPHPQGQDHALLSKVGAGRCSIYPALVFPSGLRGHHLALRCPLGSHQLHVAVYIYINIQ